jgi:predicted transposase/invertase (TIGR01784 family)
VIREDQLTLERLEDKQGILDIKAISDTGEKINVEVQLLNPYNFLHRTLFYWAKFYVEGVKSGDDYLMLKRTVAVNLLGFTMFNGHSNFQSTYKLYEDQSKRLLTDLVEIHFVEMRKFARLKPDLHDPLHRWLLFLQQDTPESLLKEAKAKDSLIEQTEDQLRLLGSDDEVRRLYEAREKHLMDETSRMRGSRNEGIEKGIKKGIKKERWLRLETY